MANSADLFLNISNGLDESMKKAEGSMNNINDVSGKINKTMEKTTKSSNMLNEDYDDIAENSEKTSAHTDKLLDGLKKVAGMAKRIVGTILGGFAIFSFGDIVHSVFSLNQEMTDLSYRMGEGGKSVGALTEAVTDTTMATGISLDRSKEWIKVLRGMRVATKDVGNLAIAGAHFGEITGASDDAVQNLTGSLYKMGGLGTKQIKNVLKGMVGAQRAFGLTSGEVNRLSETIVGSTTNLRQLGKSSADVAKFSTGVTKLAGAFASVGIKAEVAAGFIEKLMDPGAIQDNMLLFSKLGVTMEDAMSGNIDPAALVGGFKDLGAELKNMNPIAASQMAKSMGMSLTDLRAMGEMDTGELEKTFAGMTGSAGKMSEEQEKQATAQKALSTSMEKFKALAVQIGSKAMPLINMAATFIAKNFDKLLGYAKNFMGMFSGKGGKGIAVAIVGGIVAAVVAFKIFRKKFFSVNTEIGEQLRESLDTGMDESMEMGAQKSSKKFVRIMAAAVKNYTTNLQDRIIESSNYAATKASANYFKILSNTNINASAKKLTEANAEWLDKISAGAKPVSMISKWIERANENTLEAIKLTRQDAKMKINFLDNDKKAVENRIQDLRTRADQLDLISRTGKLTWAQGREQKLISKELAHQGKVQQKAFDKLEDVKTRSHAREKSYLKNLSKEQRKMQAIELKSELAGANSDLIRIKGQKELAELTLSELDSSNRIIEARLEEIKAAKTEAGISSEKLMELDEERKKLRGIRSENTELHKAQTEHLENQKKQELKVLESQEESKGKLNDILSTTSAITQREYDRLAASEEILLAQRQGFEEGTDGWQALTEEINANQKAQLGALAGTDLDVLIEPMGAKLAAAAIQVKDNLVLGLKERIGQLGDSFIAGAEVVKERINPKNWLKALRAVGEGSLTKGLAKTFAKGAKTFAKGIGGATKLASAGLSKIGGPIALIGGMLIGAMMKMDGFRKIMDKLKGVFDKVVGRLMPIIEKQLMPVFDQLINALLPLVEIVGSLLGPIMGVLVEVMKAILPIFIELVKAALPPILKVLGYLLKVISFLIENIAKLGQFIADMGKKATPKEQAMINGMKAMAGSFKSSGDAMIEASETIGKSFKDSEFGEIPKVDLNGMDEYTSNQLDLSEQTAENTDPDTETTTTKLMPFIMQATATEFVKTEDARKVVTSPAQKKALKEAEKTNKKLDTLIEKEEIKQVVIIQQAEEVKKQTEIAEASHFVKKIKRSSYDAYGSGT